MLEGRFGVSDLVRLWCAKRYSRAHRVLRTCLNLAAGVCKLRQTYYLRRKRRGWFYSNIFPGSFRDNAFRAFAGLAKTFRPVKVPAPQLSQRADDGSKLVLSPSLQCLRLDVTLRSEGQ